MESFLIRLWVPEEPGPLGLPEEAAPSAALDLHGVIDAGPESGTRPFADQDELVSGLREALAERLRERLRPPRAPRREGLAPEKAGPSPTHPVPGDFMFRPS